MSTTVGDRNFISRYRAKSNVKITKKKLDYSCILLSVIKYIVIWHGKANTFSFFRI